VWSGNTAGGRHEDGISRLQAALFCRQLHIELDRIDKEFSALETTLARQLARVDLRPHAGVTERELTGIAADRDHVHKMLAALGHAYPCRLPGCAETG
jgi:hypothetical protein